MTEPTTAEERAAKANEQVAGIAANFEALYEERDRLIADVERLTAQRDEAVRLLRQAAEFVEDHPNWRKNAYRFLASLSTVTPEEPGPTCVWCGAMDTWRHTKDGVVWERGCQCNVTEDDWAGHLKDRTQPGQTEAELRAKYGPFPTHPLGKLDKPCERVYSAGVAGGFGYYRCARHGCPWPADPDTTSCPTRIKEVWDRARRLESEPSP